MIKNKLKKTVLLRRDSNSSVFKPTPKSATPELAPMSTTNTNSTEVIDSVSMPPVPLARRRTQDDESLYVHTAKVAGTKDDLRPSVQKSTSEPNLDPPTSKQSTPSHSAPNPVDEFINRLNMDKFASFIKNIIVALINRVLNSGYVNTVNDGKIHIQSFGLGIGMTSVVVMIQPFLMVYLESWASLLSKIFKHLSIWLFVGVVSYLLKPKRNESLKDIHIEEEDDGDGERRDTYTELEYSVKNTRSSSPSRRSPAKSSKRPSVSRPTSRGIVPRRNSELVYENANGRRSSDVVYDQMMLVQMTERSQALEKARNDVEASRPATNYDKFMNVALKKDQEKEKYQKFINDNRENIKRKEVAFDK